MNKKKTRLSPIERIDLILESTNFNYTQLAKEIGLSRAQVFYDLKSGKTKEVSPDLANKINLRFPQYDLGWLLSGYGNPLVDNKYYTQKERVETLMEKENLTVDQLAEKVNIDPAIIQKILDGEEDGMVLPIAEELTQAFPNYERTWLLYGGHSSAVDYLDELHPEKLEQIFQSKAKERIYDEQSVKLYDISAAANLKHLFANKNQNILGEIKIPEMPKCDGAIYVTGDSMYPILKSGDIVMYKIITEFEALIYGEMYIVSFDINGDEYLSVKYINRSEKGGHVKLVSYNTHYAPMDIPLTSIRALGLVKMSIRKNTMM